MSDKCFVLMIPIYSGGLSSRLKVFLTIPARFGFSAELSFANAATELDHRPAPLLGSISEIVMPKDRIKQAVRKRLPYAMRIRIRKCPVVLESTETMGLECRVSNAVRNSRAAPIM